LKSFARKPFRKCQIVALGYSNGANIAGATLLKYPDFFDGAILFRPMLPFQEPVLTEKAQQVPYFFEWQT
jgi:phospholipase/carboxylesterase